jgi:hypothetical protein
MLVNFELGSTCEECRKIKPKSPSTLWPEGFVFRQVGRTGFELLLLTLPWR